jgi:hypothetical protein
MLGKLINELTNARLQAGVYNVEWCHSGLPTGVYFCSLKVDNKSEIRKLVLER